MDMKKKIIERLLVARTRLGVGLMVFKTNFALMLGCVLFINLIAGEHTVSAHVHYWYLYDLTKLSCWIGMAYVSFLSMLFYLFGCGESEDPGGGTRIEPKIEQYYRDHRASSANDPLVIDIEAYR